jgi:hypothetical protein
MQRKQAFLTPLSLRPTLKNTAAIPKKLEELKASFDSRLNN